MRERRHRLRILLADNRTALLAVLLLVTGLGLSLTYATHVSPGTTTEQRQVSSWESTGEFSHQATVTNGTDVYPEGTILRNRSAYFREITPELDGTFTYAYTATTGGNLTVRTDVSLVLQSVETGEGGGTTYWRTEEQLSSATTTGVGPGDTVSAPFSVNVSEATQRADDIDAQFGGTPGEKQVVVASELVVSGTRNGRPVDLTRRYRLPIAVEGSLYRVDDVGPTTESGAQRTQVTVPASYGPARSVGGPALLGIGLVGLTLVAAQWRYGARITEIERSWVQYRRTRDEFDEWITTGAVPTDAEGPPVVAVETLSGLVALAIDTGERVVEDRERGACLVLEDSRWYRYEIPPEPTFEEEPPVPLIRDASESVDPDDTPESDTVDTDSSDENDGE